MWGVLEIRRRRPGTLLPVADPVLSEDQRDIELQPEGRKEGNAEGEPGNANGEQSEGGDQAPESEGNGLQMGAMGIGETNNVSKGVNSPEEGAKSIGGEPSGQDQGQNAPAGASLGIGKGPRDIGTGPGDGARGPAPEGGAIGIGGMPNLGQRVKVLKAKSGKPAEGTTKDPRYGNEMDMGKRPIDAGFKGAKEAWDAAVQAGYMNKDSHNKSPNGKNPKKNPGGSKTPLIGPKAKGYKPKASGKEVMGKGNQGQGKGKKDNSKIRSEPNKIPAEGTTKDPRYGNEMDMGKRPIDAGFKGAKEAWDAAVQAGYMNKGSHNKKSSGKNPKKNPGGSKTPLKGPKAKGYKPKGSGKELPVDGKANQGHGKGLKGKSNRPKRGPKSSGKSPQHSSKGPTTFKKSPKIIEQKTFKGKNPPKGFQGGGGEEKDPGSNPAPSIWGYSLFIGKKT